MLSLDHPISKHLPSHLRLPPEIAVITVRQLATHSSGLPDEGAEHLRIQESEVCRELPPSGYYTRLMVNRAYFIRRRYEYFVEHLIGETPPKEFELGEVAGSIGEP